MHIGIETVEYRELLPANGPIRLLESAYLYCVCLEWSVKKRVECRGGVGWGGRPEPKYAGITIIGTCWH